MTSQTEMSVNGELTLEAGGAYVIRNTVTGTVYVGCSARVRDRWRKHLGALRLGHNASASLQAAWNRYGAEAFMFEVIEIVPSGTARDLRAAERRCLGQFAPTGLYNIVDIPRPTRRSSREVESIDFLAMVRRILHAAGRRVSGEDVEELVALVAMREDLDAAIVTAIRGLRKSGHTWTEIGAIQGVSKQAAEQWFGRRT